MQAVLPESANANYPLTCVRRRAFANSGNEAGIACSQQLALAPLVARTSLASWLPEVSREHAAAGVELHALFLEDVTLPSRILGVGALRHFA